MNSETRTCQACKQDFIIEPDDFTFYEKFDVPPPKKCPLCRAQHRLAFRNERVFYKRKCDKCGREVVSMYSSNKDYIVWCNDCWFSDDWDGREYGLEYDPKRPFMEQFRDLWKRVPKVALMYVRSVNSEYSNISADSKDCYMIVESSNNENCTHCYWVQQCRDLVDVSFSHQTELSYESDDCYGSSRVLYSKGCHDCRESYFLLRCLECFNCVGCTNLKKKSYYIFNQPYSKEEYFAKLKEFKLDTHEGVERLRAQFEAFKNTQPRKFAEITNGPGCTGNYIKNAKNCTNCFHCYDSEDSRYGVHVWRGAKDCMDVDTAGRGAERIYNSINSGVDTSHYISNAVCWTCAFMEYSYYCFNSNNCFGCTGLRKKDYCILNRQYDKDTYEKLKLEIVGEMRKVGEYGDFFPLEISTFGYNESAAQEQFPLTKEQTLAQGFKWENAPRGTYGKETVPWDKVPDPPYENFDAAKHVFACIECKKNFLVIPNEFLFYKKLNIPLPRMCPDCRHLRRFAARGPNRTWHRECMCSSTNSQHANMGYKNITAHFHKDLPCSNEFETSYSSDRPEIIYCQECYQSEFI